MVGPRTAGLPGRHRGPPAGRQLLTAVATALLTAAGTALPDPPQVRRYPIRRRYGATGSAVATALPDPPPQARGRSRMGGSVGPFGQALRVQDEHRLGRELEPAPGSEIGERLVDGLPGRTHQLRQLLLGEVVMDLQPVLLLLPEPVREVEQRLGDPP